MVSAIARWSGGASSDTSGNITCGITVVMPQMYEMTQNAVNEGVTHSPILNRTDGLQ